MEKTLTDPSVITETISLARREAKRLNVSINVILRCWAAGFNAARVIEFGRKRGLVA